MDAKEIKILDVRAPAAAVEAQSRGDTKVLIRPR